MLLLKKSSKVTFFRLRNWADQFRSSGRIQRRMGPMLTRNLSRLVRLIRKNRQQIKLTELGLKTQQSQMILLLFNSSLLMSSTFTNERGRHYRIGGLESTLVNGNQKYSGCSSSFLDLQKQFDEAHRKIEEQAAHNEHQEKRLNEFSLVEKFLSQTDPMFLAFIAANSQPDV
ncbi:hypothetical protein Bca4012_018588 [Brassica carinata]